MLSQQWYDERDANCEADVHLMDENDDTADLYLEPYGENLAEGAIATARRIAHHGIVGFKSF